MYIKKDAALTLSLFRYIFVIDPAAPRLILFILFSFLSNKYDTAAKPCQYGKAFFALPHRAFTHRTQRLSLFGHNGFNTPDRLIFITS